MSEGMKYLTPKKPISAIARERAEQAEMQNIDIYEAIAGLCEELAALAEQNAALEERVAELEGGQNQ
jgi:cell division protein FtsB